MLTGYYFQVIGLDISVVATGVYRTFSIGIYTPKINRLNHFRYFFF